MLRGGGGDDAGGREATMIPGEAVELAREIRGVLEGETVIYSLFSGLERRAYFPPSDGDGNPIESGYGTAVEELQSSLEKHGGRLVSLSKRLAGREEAGSRLAWEMRKLGIEK